MNILAAVDSLQKAAEAAGIFREIIAAAGTGDAVFVRRKQHEQPKQVAKTGGAAFAASGSC